jgi:hypothetical protein
MTTRDEPLKRLRRLLGHSTAVGVLADVGDIVELTTAGLDALPCLAQSRRSTLLANSSIDASVELANSGLHVRALGETSANESSVEHKQDPRTTLEEDCGDEKTNPEQHFEGRDDRHGHVVVRLDEVTNSISDGAGGLGSGSCTRALSGCHGGDDIGTGVGGYVEDGVDAVGKQSKRVLGSEEPDERHGWNISQLACNLWEVVVRATHQSTGRSHRQADQWRQ